MDTIKCLIIGSGPAGYTAAVYASRAGMDPVIYTGEEPGGQLMITTEVDNYPGYPEGVNGPQMMEDFKNQAERFGTDVRYGIVTKVDFDGDVHTAHIDNGEVVKAHTVIISTGASAKWLGLESETRLRNKGVSACAVCDGFFFKGMEVVVVGGGDTAAEEASYLAKLCPKVHMLVRRDEMRASKIMQERVMEMENIEIHWNTETVEVLGEVGERGEEEVVGVRVRNNKTNEISVIDAKAFFVAIGHKPNTGIFKGMIDMDPNGYIVTAPKSTKTNIAGVYACGDAQDSIYRQAVTAAGTGCMSALDAERYLVEQKII